MFLPGCMHRERRTHVRGEGCRSRRYFRRERLDFCDCCWLRDCGRVGDGVGYVYEGGFNDGCCGLDGTGDEDCYFFGDEDCYFVGGCGGDDLGTLWDAGSQGYEWDDDICHGRISAGVEWFGMIGFPGSRCQVVLQILEKCESHRVGFQYDRSEREDGLLDPIMGNSDRFTWSF